MDWYILNGCTYAAQTKQMNKYRIHVWFYQYGLTSVSANPYTANAAACFTQPTALLGKMGSGAMAALNHLLENINSYWINRSRMS